MIMLNIHGIRLSACLVSLGLFASFGDLLAHASDEETRLGLRGVAQLPVGRNTEQDLLGENDPGVAGFSISIDGERVAGEAPKHGHHAKGTADTPQDTSADKQRRADRQLNDVDLQVKFDGLGVKPVLNVTTSDLRHSFGPGEEITFVATTNYPGWIERAEVHITEEGVHLLDVPVRILPVERGRAVWTMPTDGGERYSYILRVFDHLGRYDETQPLALSRTSRELPTHRTSADELVSVGDGEDRTAKRNIPVYGGAVTVFGRNVPLGARAFALGRPVPIDADGSFVTQQILPPGQHAIDVRVADPHENDVAITRDIHIPDNEWFYVGLADLTAGRRFGDRSFRETEPGEFEKTYAKGRLAFYLKGKVRGRYLLTAAADTQEDDLENIFRGMDSKDPRQLLRRIDPDKYYPVYGDDSEILEDAPTNGKFYVRLERGDSHVLWGNFKTSISGTEFARNERGLYGAHVRHRSEDTTEYGERRTEVEAYASQPGTLPQRDILRGTGGSAYFLSRQDITRGSETVTVEVRDIVTGVVRSRRALAYGADYQIDYIQGVIILDEPLASTVRSGPLVQNNPLGDDAQSLVVQYEYTPTLTDADGYSYGGRAQAWLTDNLRVGVSGFKEESGAVDQQLGSADLRLQFGKNSHVQVEVARSEGPGFGRTESLNGGLTTTTDASVGLRGTTAYAGRAELKADLSDFSSDLRGSVGAYYDKREAGFSSIDYNTSITQRTIGVHARIDFPDGFRYLLNYEDFTNKNDVVRRQGDAEVEFEFVPGWTVGLGYKYTQVRNDIQIKGDGTRNDLGLRFTYQRDDDFKAYGFMQATVGKTEGIGNNARAGIGAEARVTEKIWLQGEVSGGSIGWGGLAGLKYDKTADDHYYVGYRLDPERSISSPSALYGTDMGNVILGAKTRYTDTLSGYAENSYDIFGRRRSLTTTYGVTYTPTALWTVKGGVEHGDVNDRNGESLTRTAISSSVSYNEKERMTWKLKGEARFEDSDDLTKNRDTFLVSSGINVRRNENWRLLANIDAVFSNSNQSDILDGDYVEASFGAAYRPIDNDEWNALFKYTYLYDLPGANQVTVSGTTLGPAQRSHIISADVSYQMNEYITIGGKYGARFGEVSTTRNSNDFVRSSAHLGVLRLDAHVVKNWDVLVEGRVLSTPELKTTQTGFLAAVYRHVGENVKIGIGYNFGEFSDDVSDLTFDDKGVFINFIGKL